MHQFPSRANTFPNADHVPLHEKMIVKEKNTTLHHECYLSYRNIRTVKQSY